jgi:hypothetical protein
MACSRQDPIKKTSRGRTGSAVIAGGRVTGTLSIGELLAGKTLASKLLAGKFLTHRLLAAHSTAGPVTHLDP